MTCPVWMMEVGPLEGNWEDADSFCVLWASRNAGECMFGLEDLNLTGLPVYPNSADFFQKAACRWRPFGGDEDTGRIFRMSTRCIALKKSSALFLCIDIDKVSKDECKLPDGAELLVKAFLDGRLEQQRLPTETGPRQHLPPDLKSPTLEQRRYGFRDWISKLNLSPEIVFRTTVDPIDDLSRYNVAHSWYIVSQNHHLVEEYDDPTEPPETAVATAPTRVHVARIFADSQLYWPDWLPAHRCSLPVGETTKKASFDDDDDDTCCLRESGIFEVSGFLSIIQRYSKTPIHLMG